MFKRLFRHRCAILAICLVCYSLRAIGADLGDDLRSKYQGKQVMLRNFYCGKSLRFDEQGKLVSGGSAGPWTLCRDIRVEDIKLKSGSLRISGRRIYLFYNSNTKQFNDISELLDRSKDRYKDLVKMQQVTIEAALPADAGEQSVQAILDSLFYHYKDQFPADVPDFWKPYFRGGFPFAIIAKPAANTSAPTTTEKPLDLYLPSPSANAGRPEHVGRGVSAPVPVYMPDPIYSEEARQAAFQGTVALNIIVGPDGEVRRPVVIQQPLGMGLDETAVARVLTWKFKPATKDGNPVAVEVKVEVQFNLY